MQNSLNPIEEQYCDDVEYAIERIIDMYGKNEISNSLAGALMSYFIKKETKKSIRKDFDKLFKKTSKNRLTFLDYKSIKTQYM